MSSFAYYFMARLSFFHHLAETFVLSDLSTLFQLYLHTSHLYCKVIFSEDIRQIVSFSYVIFHEVLFPEPLQYVMTVTENNTDDI